jgi:hypothetical protein
MKQQIKSTLRRFARNTGAMSISLSRGSSSCSAAPSYQHPTADTANAWCSKTHSLPPQVPNPICTWPWPWCLHQFRFWRGRIEIGLYVSYLVQRLVFSSVGGCRCHGSTRSAGGGGRHKSSRLGASTQMRARRQAALVMPVWNGRSKKVFDPRNLFRSETWEV